MIEINYNIIFGFFTSLILTYLLIPRLIVFADRYRLSDVAGKRASHEGSIPIFGGIAIFLAIIVSLLFFADLREIQFIITEAYTLNCPSIFASLHFFCFSSGIRGFQHFQLLN